MSTLLVFFFKVREPFSAMRAPSLRSLSSISLSRAASYTTRIPCSLVHSYIHSCMHACLHCMHSFVYMTGLPLRPGMHSLNSCLYVVLFWQPACQQQHVLVCSKSKSYVGALLVLLASACSSCCCSSACLMCRACSLTCNTCIC